MNEETLQAIVVTLLSAGGATFIWTVVKSFIAWRDSAEGREDKAVGRLEKFEEDCRRQLAAEREMGVYWFRVCGIYEHALYVNGVQPPPIPAPPPSLTDSSPT